MFKSSKVRLGEVFSRGAVAGLAEAAYVISVVMFMLFTNVLFSVKSPLNIYAPVVMLILLVLSVAVSAGLVFGYPLYYALNKQYQEAVYAFGGTVLALGLVFLLVFAVAILTWL